MDGSGTEEQHPVDTTEVRQVQVPVHDAVDGPEPPAKRPVKAQEHGAPHHERQQRGGKLGPPAASAVCQTKTVSCDLDDAGRRERDARRPVVVALHRDHGRHLSEPVEYHDIGDVTCVQDQIDADQGVQHRLRQLCHPFAHVGVGHHPDARDPGQRVTDRWRDIPRRRTGRAP